MPAGSLLSVDRVPHQKSFHSVLPTLCLVVRCPCRIVLLCILSICLQLSLVLLIERQFCLVWLLKLFCSFCLSTLVFFYRPDHAFLAVVVLPALHIVFATTSLVLCLFLSWVRCLVSDIVALILLLSDAFTFVVLPLSESYHLLPTVSLPVLSFWIQQLSWLLLLYSFSAASSFPLVGLACVVPLVLLLLQQTVHYSVWVCPCPNVVAFSFSFSWCISAVC